MSFRDYIEEPIEVVLPKFWARVNKSAPNGCWEWTGAKERKYGRFYLTSRIHLLAHRISWEIAHGEISDTLCVLHKCDNPSCINPDHLFLGTKGDNNRDRASKGRTARSHQHLYSPKGERHPGHKMTEAAVRELRTLYSNGASQSQLAEQFGIRQCTVSQIVLRRTWRDI